MRKEKKKHVLQIIINKALYIEKEMCRCPLLQVNEHLTSWMTRRKKKHNNYNILSSGL